MNNIRFFLCIGLVTIGYNANGMDFKSLYGQPTPLQTYHLTVSGLVCSTQDPEEHAQIIAHAYSTETHDMIVKAQQEQKLTQSKQEQKERKEAHEAASILLSQALSEKEFKKAQQIGNPSEEHRLIPHNKKNSVRVSKTLPQRKRR